MIGLPNVYPPSVLFENKTLDLPDSAPVQIVKIPSLEANTYGNSESSKVELILVAFVNPGGSTCAKLGPIPATNDKLRIIAIKTFIQLSEFTSII
ncbi:MAG: hypothetical protein ACREAN_01610 [Nitrosopumilaceae archaeon]